MMKIVIVLIFSIKVFSQNPHVTAIYPTSDSIPVNILRFYIQFSAPIQEMDILKHIQLTNEEGENSTGVFFENQYELWNKDRTKITLIIDPGRVKLGLYANNKMGRAFDIGKKYTLTIDSLLLDFNDKKLKKSFTKTFIAVKEDNLAPDIKTWNLLLPKSKTKETITINLNDKIDHISAQTYIKIVHNKKEIHGEISLKNKEQKWVFKPNMNWRKGNYTIIIHPHLEDIVANSMNQIFDHSPLDLNQENKVLKINFKIE